MGPPSLIVNRENMLCTNEVFGLLLQPEAYRANFTTKAPPSVKLIVRQHYLFCLLNRFGMVKAIPPGQVVSEVIDLRVSLIRH